MWWRRNGEEDVLWRPWIANLVEGIFEGALLVRPQRYAEVNLGPNWGLADTLPFLWDDIPFVLCALVAPIWWEGLSGDIKVPRNEGAENKEPEIMHSCGKTVSIRSFHEMCGIRYVMSHESGLRVERRKRG
jgi:hypothetical protein